MLLTPELTSVTAEVHVKTHWTLPARPCIVSPSLHYIDLLPVRIAHIPQKYPSPTATCKWVVRTVTVASNSANGYTHNDDDEDDDDDDDDDDDLLHASSCYLILQEI